MLLEHTQLSTVCRISQYNFIAVSMPSGWQSALPSPFSVHALNLGYPVTECFSISPPISKCQYMLVGKWKLGLSFHQTQKFLLCHQVLNGCGTPTCLQYLFPRVMAAKARSWPVTNYCIFKQPYKLLGPGAWACGHFLFHVSTISRPHKA